LIKNPTQFDASVSIFAETSRQSLKTLDYTAFINWPKLKLKAGETRQINIATGGKIEEADF
jgi:hypothetical protein